MSIGETIAASMKRPKADQEAAPPPEQNSAAPATRTAPLVDRYGNPPNRHFHRRYPAKRADGKKHPKAGEWMTTKEGQLWLLPGGAAIKAREAAAGRGPAPQSTIGGTDSNPNRSGPSVGTDANGPGGIDRHDVVGAAFADQVEGFGVVIGGVDARMRTDERQRIARAFAQYDREVGLPDIPPGWLVLFTVSPYVFRAFQTDQGRKRLEKASESFQAWRHGGRPGQVQPEKRLEVEDDQEVTR